MAERKFNNIIFLIVLFVAKSDERTFGGEERSSKQILTNKVRGGKLCKSIDILQSCDIQLLLLVGCELFYIVWQQQIFFHYKF